ncbi:MAG: TIGR00282 family metallophosphoesterase [Patescibacteria group bacterium]|nr:TIGR00282 family metallophosphoesterase [Patescibacteria group bacterium]MDD5491008.1 TIGR00282 family metallophosphoesterase [Patescibacteria group bacterium]
MKILFLGDVDGKTGREAVKKTLPELKKEYAPDIVIANGENMAHGLGIAPKSMQELIEAGVDFFTSGNHVWDKKEIYEVLKNPELKDKIIRPANYPPGVEGEGYKIIPVDTKSLLVINLVGRVFFSENFDCPFRALDDILTKTKNKKIDGIIVDFHAEATSEKVALGWYADGRVAAVIGTHTHVQTADEKILPRGTAYLSDAGMTGSVNSIIGASKENVLKIFLTQVKQPIEAAEDETAIINGVLVEINPKNKLAEKILRINKEIKI